MRKGNIKIKHSFGMSETQKTDQRCWCLVRRDGIVRGRIIEVA